VPPAIIGDPVRLRQVLVNLLSNALKFTARGAVRLRLSAESADASHVALHVEVSDTGIGIPPEKLTAIFEKFTQADGSTTRKFGGTGLGLAIASELVKMMGGCLGVDSTPDAGSTFRFTLPLDVAAAPMLPHHPDRRDTEQVPPMQILLAEDNVVNQMIAQRLLQRQGHTVSTAVNGREAIDALANGRFDVVLMDVQMPEMNGFEAVAAIRAAERADNRRHQLIVAMTAHALKGDRERCLQAGMDAYISKPISAETLRRVLNEVIQDDGSRSQSCPHREPA